MAVIINRERQIETIPRELLSILPYRLSDEIRRVAGGERVEEIRLRCERCASITIKNRSLMLSCVLSRDEMDAFLSSICKNSLYAYKDTINSGYVTLRSGIRVGVCGRATIDDGRVLGVYDVSSMNIRIPLRFSRIGEPVCRILRSQKGGRGVLVYALPGEGKTTLIASVCVKMASGETPLRVCAVDTRGELSGVLKEKSLCLDILSGYPRGLGIEIATRTMNAELIVCDEIGDVGEAEAIISAQNSGVPFLATAHADNLYGLLRRSPIRLLHGAGVFGSYVGIKRSDSGEIRYTVNSWEEADAALYNSGGAYTPLERT